MPQVIKVSDQNELIAANQYPYAKFPFEFFNPVQSRVFDYYDKDVSGVIASATSSGKTCAAEMFLSHEIRKRGGKGMYLVPLKALAQEKIEDWLDVKHHFGDLKVSICSGDYRLTDSRKKELEEADLIIITYEMLAHRVRHNKSEKSEFLSKVGTLVCDEVHLLTDKSRGHNAETALMRFTEINPKARLILLSATMPNVDEIANWSSHILTQKDAFLLTSKYRPCPLTIHYEKYYDGEKTYDANEAQKVNMAMQVIEYYPEDKFLVFAHTKRTGELMKSSLLQAGFTCEFHNADLTKEKRTKLEENFKNKDGGLQVVVATSTLAAGINMPARRVIVLGVHRGLEEVSALDIIQECGRAGRPAYDTMGDAYVLLPEKTFDDYKVKLKTPQPIRSQLLENVNGRYKTLAFHLVAEIHQGNIVNRNDVFHWYKRSLAAFQSMDLDSVVIESTLDLLKKCRAIWEEDGKFTTTAIGTIASLFYYSPLDVYDLKLNFDMLFEKGNEEDDMHLSVALGNVDTQRCNIVSRAEKDEMNPFMRQVGNAYGTGVIFDAAVKAAYAYNLLMNGKSSNFFAGFSRGLQFDFERMKQVLQALDGYTGKWGKRSWLNRLGLRIKHGVKGDVVYLCTLPGIAKVRANKLWSAGIRTLEDVARDENAVKNALKCKDDFAKNVCDAAKKMCNITI